MRHKLAALAATTVIVAGGSLANATSASATIDPPAGGWDHTWTTTDAKQGGTVYVEEYGDVVQVCDTAADGVSPLVDVYYFNSTTNEWIHRYQLRAGGGVGSCASASASQGGAYNLPEGAEIEVDVWLNEVPDYASEHFYLNDH
jgi:hypothetical protein